MPGLDIYNAAGIAGAAIVIIAYFATQAGFIGVNDPRFAWANLVGAALIVTSLLADWNLAAFVMELFWIAISVFGLFRHYARR